MSKHEMFLVVITEQVDASGMKWRVKGRAYDDIEVGDSLYLEVAGPDLDAHSPVFEVIGCWSYGVELPGLSRTMTGEVILSGPHGDLLRENDILLAR